MRLRLLNSTEQVAEHLRKELANRTWIGMMPGGSKLAGELGVGVNTVEAALRMLEKEGWLVNQGRRRGRMIQQKKKTQPTDTRMQVCIFLGESADRHQPYLLELVNTLEEGGHAPFFARRSQTELRDDVQRIAHFVKETAADAWVVCSATQNVLQWFADSDTPAFALAGRANQVKIPSIGPDKITPLRLVLRELVDLGHRRIVNICRPMRRKPEPGKFERAFLMELQNLGIQTGPYNLPDWDETIESFHSSLESLFLVTPPTALLIDEGPLVTAALQFSARAGLRIPEDLSLVSSDPDPSFAWCQPSIAHIDWDIRPISRRIVNWVQNVAEGKPDDKKEFSAGKFVNGGTIGPVPE